MPQNFNTAPVQQSARDWTDDYPYSSSVAQPVVEADPWGSNSTWGNDTAPTPQFQNGSEAGQFGERLRELKDKITRGVGKNALEIVMNRLPSFGKKDAVQGVASSMYEAQNNWGMTQRGANALYENRDTFASQSMQFATSAGFEIAGSAALGAKEAVMNYYGLEKDGNDKLRVARKAKFGRAVVKSVINPVGTASSVGMRAAHGARKAAKNEAIGQVKAARSNVIDSAKRFSQAPPQPASVDAWGSGWAA